MFKRHSSIAPISRPNPTQPDPTRVPATPTNYNDYMFGHYLLLLLLVLVVVVVVVVVVVMVEQDEDKEEERGISRLCLYQYRFVKECLGIYLLQGSIN